MKLQNSLTWVHRRDKKQPKPVPRRPRRLELEALEDRLTPTVVFRPHFTNSGGLPAETLTADSRNAAQVDPQVFVLFWGTYWGTARGASDAQRLLTLSQRVIASPYLTKEIQYGSDGKASFGASFIDKDHNPPPNFSTTDLQSFLQHAIDNEGSPIPRPTTTPTSNIYVVITDPSATSNDTGAVGYNTNLHYTEPNLASTHDPMSAIWAGTKLLPNTTIDQREFTIVISHELAEDVSDPQMHGVHIAPPASLPVELGPDRQIADNEPADRYGYPVNGCVVQAYWSVQDAAFVVADGNQQQLLLDPIWNQFNVFTDSYNLTIRGGQRAFNFADTISVSQDGSGRVGVSLNGESFTFEPNAISSITINVGLGTEQVNLSAPVDTTVNGSATTSVVISAVGKALFTINRANSVKIDASRSAIAANITINNASSVNVGNGRADRVVGQVTIHGPSVTTALTVDGRSDPGFGRTTTVQTRRVVRSSLLPILFDAGRLSSLSILIGTGLNFVNLGGPVDPLDKVPAKITVTGRGPTTLTVDGESSVDNLYTLTNGSVQGATRVHVINPSGIGFVTTVRNQISYSHIDSLTVHGQKSAGTTFLVKSSQPSTQVFLAGGTASDEYDFGNSSTSLNNLTGAVTIMGGGLGTVNVDDTFRNSHSAEVVDIFTLTAGQITRNAIALVGINLVPYNASISYQKVTKVNLLGSNLATTFMVESTLAGTPVSVRGGTGANTFQVGDATHSLDLLQADVTLTGTGALTLDDEATAVPREEEFVTGQLNRFIPGTNRRLFTVHFQGMATVTFDNAGGGSSIAVEAIPAGVALTVNGHAGSTDQIVAYVETGSILGTLTFRGQGTVDHDFAEYYDFGRMTAQTYLFQTDPADASGEIVLQPGMNPATFDGVDEVIAFTAQVGGSTIDVQSCPQPLVVNLSASNGDSVLVGSGGTLVPIQGAVLVGANTADAIISLTADDSADPFGKAVTIDPPPPDDPQNTVTAVTGLASGAIEWILNPGCPVTLLGGSGGNSFVIHGALPPVELTIDAGSGNNVLIAGQTAVNFIGGTGSDLLIGGSTDYDFDPNAIAAIMIEWALANEQTFGTIVTDLSLGENGLPVLSANTVHANGLANQLTGGAAPDWFFASSLDQALDFSQADHDFFTGI